MKNILPVCFAIEKIHDLLFDRVGRELSRGKSAKRDHGGASPVLKVHAAAARPDHV
jgi:hypothetical protein